MKQNKTLKVLTSAALLASLATPFAAPAFANSSNVVSKTPKIADDFESKTTADVVSVLTFEEDDVAFTSGDTFRLTLPSGVKWAKDSNGNYLVAAPGSGLSGATVVSVSDQTLELKMQAADNSVSTPKEKISVPMLVKVDGATGELKVTVDPQDSTLTAGSYTFAVASSGNTTSVVEDVKTIGSTGQVGTIRIDENSIGAVGDAQQTVTVKLPANFSWTGTPTVRFAGGFAVANATNSAPPTTVANGAAYYQIDGRTLTITFNPNDNRTARGTIYIEGASVKADGASKGNIDVSITGTKVSDADFTLAKYADWGASVKVEEVKELVAGKADDVNKTAKITIEEDMANSLIAGRDIDLELPSWVKVVGVTDFNSSGFGTAATLGTVDGTKNKVSVTINSNTSGSTKGKIEFKLQLSIQADKAGDIEAKLSGAGLAEQKVVVAKAIAPVTVDSEAKNVKIGVQDQEASDIIITENRKEAVEKNYEGFSYNGSNVLQFTGNSANTTSASGGVMTITLPAGVSFASTPKVEVIEGNAEIEQDAVTRSSNSTGYNNVLNIPIKSESTKPAKIKISGVKLTVDRTVPEGAIEAKVGGTAVVENGNSSAPLAGQFGTTSAVKFTIAKTVTPAPADTTATNVVFKLNSKTLTVDGKTIEMDAAPLVAWDRAFLPIRFAANALNVSDDQIVWDDKTSTATIFKGDRVITAKVGDKFLTVNGVKVPMDVPVYRSKAATNNRVMIPIRYLANALNAEITWNKETSEITIQAKK